MIRHAFRLAWNRRRENGLVLAELTLSFLVLCLVFGVGIFLAAGWQRPLGFDWREVWVVNAQPDSSGSSPGGNARSLAAARAALAAIRSHPEVEVATPMSNSPYSNSHSVYGIYADRKLIQFLWVMVLPEARETLRLELVAGRWLAPGDERLGYTPVVINRELGRLLFGGADPVGRKVPHEKEDGSSSPPKDPRDELRVVGVISDYRKNGEPSPKGGAAFAPARLDDPERGEIPRHFLLRLKPGVPARFEQTLARSLGDAAPTWNFNIEPLSAERSRWLRKWLLPFSIGAIVAGFLVLTAGMGLIGVLWQNVSRRRAELGVRRAFGSTGREVQALVLLEVGALAVLAAMLGCALFLQLPLLGVFPAAGPAIYLGAAAAALVVLVGFVLLCALYPSWLATRVLPAESLRWE